MKPGSYQAPPLVLTLSTVVTVALLAFSGISPYDRATWWMEVMPVLIVFPVLWATYSRSPLTSLLYVLIALHAAVLMLGGAYTYARVPLGDWVQTALTLDRNPYDKLGHLFQGFVPAIAAREIFIRGAFIRGAAMRNGMVICTVLAISASYELIEWAAALLMGQGADEFLGTQGDPWDTQSDMFCALLGAIFALLSLSRWHDRQLGRFAARA